VKHSAKSRNERDKWNFITYQRSALYPISDLTITITMSGISEYSRWEIRYTCFYSSTVRRWIYPCNAEFPPSERRRTIGASPHNFSVAPNIFLTWTAAAAIKHSLTADKCEGEAWSIDWTCLNEQFEWAFATLNDLLDRSSRRLTLLKISLLNWTCRRIKTYIGMVYGNHESGEQVMLLVTS